MFKSKWIIIGVGALVVVIIAVLCGIFLRSGSKSVAEDGQFGTISTKSGKIRGKQNLTLFEKMPYFSFRGIPFAKPPIKNFRFKAPQQIEPWNSTLNAFDFGGDCVQTTEVLKIHFGTEDCLYLNVYVPADCSALNSSTKFPVMVYIYGGANLGGSSSFYGPDFFMEENVVIVTFNYRADIFGFLTLNLTEYSGNMGLKDQALALRWVYENIEQFGGDKDNITLFGHSSGAVSVNLHMISPQSNKLFQKAILLSGSALMPFATGPNNHYAIIEYLAENLGSPVSNINEMIEFLQEIDEKRLTKRSYENTYIPGLGRKTENFIWTSCVEDKNAVEPFLTETPFDILIRSTYKSTIDTLYSITPNEVVRFELEKNPELLETIDREFQFQLPLKMATVDYDSMAYQDISKRIRNSYFNESSINFKTLNELNTLFSDLGFLYAIDLSARIQAAKSSGRTFFNIISASNEWNLSKRRAKYDNDTSSDTHTDTVPYIFRFTEHSYLLSDMDYQYLTMDSIRVKLIKIITNFFANFAKYRNPIPDERPIYFKSPNNIHYHTMKITNDDIRSEHDLYRDRMEFWNNIFDEYKHMWNTTFKFQWN